MMVVTQQPSDPLKPLHPKCSICGACACESSMVKKGESGSWICDRHPQEYYQVVCSFQEGNPQVGETP